MKIRFASLLIIVMLLVGNLFAGSDLKGSVQVGSLTASAPPQPTVTLTVTPSTTGAAAVSFNFYRGTSSGVCATVGGGNVIPVGCTLAGSATAPAVTFVDTMANGITWSMTYYYVVTAVGNGCGSAKACESGASPQFTAVIPANPVPNPPSGLTGTVTVAGNVELRWKAPTEPVYAYRIYRKLASHNSYTQIVTGIKSTSYVDKPGHGSFDYEVKAVTLAGHVLSGPSNVLSVTVS
jgi:hypothetical protein